MRRWIIFGSNNILASTPLEEATDTFRDVSMFTPFFEYEVREIMLYEKGKETLRALLKAQIASAHEGV